MSLQEYDTYRQFLDDFAEKIDPRNQIPVRVEGYNLTEAELPGVIVYWSSLYLVEKSCPPTLVAPIICRVNEAINKDRQQTPQLCGYHPETNLFDPLKLMQRVTSRVNDVCLNLLDNAQLDKIPPPPPQAQRPPRHSVSSMRNKRRSMEDRHICIDDFNQMFGINNAPPASYYGVFDGHAGVEAAVYSSAHLNYNIAKSKHYPVSPAEAMREAFIQTDNDFVRKCGKQNLRSGTTALCALLRPTESRLYVGWAGDSQAMLITQNKVMQLVTPHRAQDEKEKQRITALGGCVMLIAGQWRVGGSLAITRAIGDPGHKPFVTSEPEIICVPLSGNEDCLVLACDGLWDHVTEDCVAYTVLQQIKEDPDNIQKVTDKLVKQAKAQGSQDNISVIVVFLKDTHQIAAASTFLSDANAMENMETTNANDNQNAVFGMDFKSSDPYAEVHDMVANPFALSTGPKGQNGDDDQDMNEFLVNDITQKSTTNGNHSANNFEDEDLGPETDVDAVDEAMMSPGNKTMHFVEQSHDELTYKHDDNVASFNPFSNNMIQEEEDEAELKPKDDLDINLIEDNKILDEAHAQDEIKIETPDDRHDNNDFSEKREFSFEREEYEKEMESDRSEALTETLSPSEEKPKELLAAFENEKDIAEISHGGDFDLPQHENQHEIVDNALYQSDAFHQNHFDDNNFQQNIPAVPTMPTFGDDAFEQQEDAVTELQKLGTDFLQQMQNDRDLINENFASNVNEFQQQLMGDHDDNNTHHFESDPNAFQSSIQDQDIICLSGAPSLQNPVLIAESGEESEDEWNYVKVNKQEKPEHSQIEEEKEEPQIETEPEAAFIAVEEPLVEEVEKFELEAKVEEKEDKHLVEDEEELYDQELRKIEENSPVEESKAIAQGLAESEECCEIEDLHPLEQLNSNREPDQSDIVADQEVQQTYEEMMDSQLNPDAKPFVPLSPTNSNPSSPLGNFNNLNEGHPLNGPSPVMKLLLTDDMVIAQSPRKGGPPMENFDLPPENVFDSEIACRPGELDTVPVAIVDSQQLPIRPGSSSSQASYQEMNLKESMHGDEKLDYAPEDELSTLGGGVTLQPTDLLSKSLRETDPMSMSFYNEPNPFNNSSEQTIPQNLSNEGILGNDPFSTFRHNGNGTHDLASPQHDEISKPEEDMYSPVSDTQVYDEFVAPSEHARKSVEPPQSPLDDPVIIADDSFTTKVTGAFDEPDKYNLVINTDFSEHVPSVESDKPEADLLVGEVSIEKTEHQSESPLPPSSIVQVVQEMASEVTSMLADVGFGTERPDQSDSSQFEAEQFVENIKADTFDKYTDNGLSPTAPDFNPATQVQEQDYLFEADTKSYLSEEKVQSEANYLMEQQPVLSPQSLEPENGSYENTPDKVSPLEEHQQVVGVETISAGTPATSELMAQQQDDAKISEPEQLIETVEKSSIDVVAAGVAVAAAATVAATTAAVVVAKKKPESASAAKPKAGDAKKTETKAKAVSASASTTKAAPAKRPITAPSATTKSLSTAKTSPTSPTKTTRAATTTTKAFAPSATARPTPRPTASPRTTTTTTTLASKKPLSGEVKTIKKTTTTTTSTASSVAPGKTTTTRTTTVTMNKTAAARAAALASRPTTATKTSSTLTGTIGTTSTASKPILTARAPISKTSVAAAPKPRSAPLSGTTRPATAPRVPSASSPTKPKSTFLTDKVTKETVNKQVSTRTVTSKTLGSPRGTIASTLRKVDTTTKSPTAASRTMTKTTSTTTNNAPAKLTNGTPPKKPSTPIAPTRTSSSAITKRNTPIKKAAGGTPADKKTAASSAKTTTTTTTTTTIVSDAKQLNGGSDMCELITNVVETTKTLTLEEKNEKNDLLKNFDDVPAETLQQQIVIDSAAD